MRLRTYVPIFVFALSAAPYIADGSDVPLQESHLIVKNGDAVLLYHKCQCWNDPSLWWVSVVISILANRNKNITINLYEDGLLYFQAFCILTLKMKI